MTGGTRPGSETSTCMPVASVTARATGQWQELRLTPLAMCAIVTSIRMLVLIFLSADKFKKLEPAFVARLALDIDGSAGAVEVGIANVELSSWCPTERALIDVF